MRLTVSLYNCIFICIFEVRKQHLSNPLTKNSSESALKYKFLVPNAQAILNYRLLRKTMFRILQT